MQVSVNRSVSTTSFVKGHSVDITQLILEDHHEQRRLFAMLYLHPTCRQLDDQAA
jgi:hypothetical protein